MEIDELDFSKSKYDLKSDVSVFTRYKELKAIYAETEVICENNKWKEFLTPEQVMRFVIFCYHRYSPIVEKIVDLQERKTTALLLSGVDVVSLQKKDESKKLIAQILLAREEFTARLALNFAKSENNMIWAEYVTLLDILGDAMYQMLNPNLDSGNKTDVEIAEKKSKLYDGTRKYRDDLNKLADKLFHQDTELQSFMSSQIVKMKRNRLITPEDMVRLTPEELTEAFMQRGIVR